MPEIPEQQARQAIGANWPRPVGWCRSVTNSIGRRDAVSRSANSQWIAFGAADYLLYLDRKAIGAVEAKAEGTLTGVEATAEGTLTGVEARSAKYSAGLADNLPAYARPLPFQFELNGAVTQFTIGLDPVPHSRPVFNFPRPATLADWIVRPDKQPGRRLPCRLTCCR
jgi:type I restriction enzyme R subunit